MQEAAAADADARLTSIEADQRNFEARGKWSEADAYLESFRMVAVYNSQPRPPRLWSTADSAVVSEA